MTAGSSPKARTGWFFLAALGFCCLIAVAGCGHPPRTYRIGLICGGDSFVAAVEGFKEGMEKQGYVEGQNVTYLARLLAADAEAIKRAAKELVDQKLDLLFAVPTEPALAAKAAAAGKNTPVLFAYAGLEGSGLVESVRHPGNAITGVRYPGVDLIAKRFELLQEAVPGVKRLLICYDREYPIIPPVLDMLRGHARAAGITLVEVPVTTVDAMAKAMKERARRPADRVDAVMIVPDMFNTSPIGWAAIRDYASLMRVPVAGSQRFTVEQGAIFGNAADVRKAGTQASLLAKKILSGIPAGNLPVISPEYELWVSPGRMKDLGLPVPVGLLRMATEIVQWEPDSVK
jgi:putative ABC transport system substrate-binding protein